MRLVQVAQRAHDLDRAVRFYRDVLRLRHLATFDPPGLAFFDLDGVRLLLERGASSALVYIGVDDVQGQVEQFQRVTGYNGRIHRTNYLKMGWGTLALRRCVLKSASIAYKLFKPDGVPLRAFITSGPSVALVVEGDEAIEVVRALNGATDGRKAAPGTIRGDYSLSNRENLVHGSDSPESAAREIAFWFPELG